MAQAEVDPITGSNVIAFPERSPPAPRRRIWVEVDEEYWGIFLGMGPVGEPIPKPDKG